VQIAQNLRATAPDDDGIPGMEGTTPAKGQRKGRIMLRLSMALSMICHHPPVIISQE
jgi:hypothetical protein